MYIYPFDLLLYLLGIWVFKISLIYNESIVTGETRGKHLDHGCLFDFFCFLENCILSLATFD